MKRIGMLSLFGLLLLSGVVISANAEEMTQATPATPAITASDAFETLAGLAGTWRGVPEGEGLEAEAEAAAVVHEFQLSAAGTVVMETMGPGSPHEMINMYHVDGENLVVTHYCAGGNQPKMKLDLTKSTTESLVFAFTGGTNFDPWVDDHIHEAQISLVGDQLTSLWRSYSEGQPAGTMTFHLARAE